ncbi:MAG: hypothetical protein JWP32_2887 [Schumannella sp.]|nr:hypothetical protein [Schumannella sp.]
MPISYSVDGAAQAIGVSVDVIRKAVRDLDLPVRYYGRKPLIPAAALEKWFAGLPAERKRA